MSQEDAGQGADAGAVFSLRRSSAKLQSSKATSFNCREGGEMMSEKMHRIAVVSVAAMLLGVAGVTAAVADDGTGGTPTASPTDWVTPSPTETEDPADQVETDDPAGLEDPTDVPVSEEPHMHPQRCDAPSTWINITSKQSQLIPAWWTPEFKDGPGGSVTGSVTKTGTISASLTATGNVTIGAILAKAKTQVSASITGSVAIAVGHTYSHNIASKKYGHLQYGDWGYLVHWKKYRLDSDTCGGIVTASGTAKLPTHSVGFKYWETSS
ncbi:hypothetical protein [Streptomyces griseoluteus]|uniref:hypothetical protein n=1 Tax=Streptomyces griseoluteus TaxID=29306 RepID=UPI0036CA33E9